MVTSRSGIIVHRPAVARRRLNHREQSAPRHQCRAGTRSCGRSLTWAYAGGHGSCGGLEVSNLSITGEKARARDQRRTVLAADGKTLRGAIDVLRGLFASNLWLPATTGP